MIPAEHREKEEASVRAPGPGAGAPPLGPGSEGPAAKLLTQKRPPCEGGLPGPDRLLWEVTPRNPFARAVPRVSGVPGNQM